MKLINQAAEFSLELICSFIFMCGVAVYLPGVSSECVDLKRDVAVVHQRPQPTLGVKGQVQGAVGQGEFAVWDQPLLSLLVQGEELKRGLSEDTRRDWSAGSDGRPLTSADLEPHASENTLTICHRNKFRTAEVKNGLLFVLRWL